MLLFVRLATAQVTLQDATDQYFQKLWQTDEGLPNNIVTSILQTRDGFLWVGTLDGLVRFDGVRFDVFMPSNLDAPGANRILHLHEDRSGKLWIGTDGGGLVWMQDGKFQMLTKDDGLKHNRVETMGEDADGNIWVGMFGGEVNCISNGKIIGFGNTNALAGRKLTAIVRDSKGVLWFNTTQVLSLRRGDEFVLIREHPEESGQITASRSNGIWYVDHKRIQRFEGADVVYDSGELPWDVKRGEVRTLLEDHRGVLWIGTHGSDLFRFENGLLEKLDTPHNNILALCQDDEGSLWAGTEGGGLNRLRGRAFSLYDANHGLPKDVVFSICEDRDGVVWVVPQAAGLWKFKDGAFSPFENLGPLQDQLVNCVAAGADGSLWIGTEQNGLYGLKGNAFQPVGGRRGLARKSIRAVLIDSRNEVWIGTAKNGVGHFIKGKLVEFKRQNGLSGNGIRALAEDKAGNIWIGNVKGFLDRISGETIRNFTTADGLPGIAIRTLHPTSDGSLWIGTAGGGLLRFKNERFTRITEAQGLYSDGISQILEDDTGNFWFGSSRGIFHVAKQALDELADGRRERIECHPYDKSEGLPSIQCTHGYHPAACKTRDGQLWFSTSKGALRLDRGAMEILEAPLRVFIERLELDGKKIEIKDSLQIPPGNHRIKFQFTSPAFVAPEKITFRYTLEGFDREWVDGGSQRTADYPRVPPGEYIFRVAARKNGGAWTEQDASFRFSVLPAYWQTLWFRLTTLAAFTLGIIAVVRFILVRRFQRKMQFLEQQHALERERSRIARDMHDDLGASLTQIAFLSELAQKELQSSETVRKRISRIAERAREVVAALDEIVWAVNPRNDTLESLVEYLSHFVDDFLRHTGIRCHQELPDNLPHYALSSELRHNLFLAVKEALTNVVKHAGASELWFRVTVNGRILEIAIEDNGRGFVLDAVAEQGEGLRNMRERTTQAGGGFNIQSAPGKGTKAILKFQLPSTRH